jgi:hypothetical protein
VNAHKTWTGEPGKCTCPRMVVATLAETLGCPCGCPCGWLWRPGIGFVHVLPGRSR